MDKPITITAERIRDLRLRLGLSQAAFGRKVGVSQGSVANWERSGVPSNGTASVALRSLYPELKKMSAPHNTTGR